MERTYWNSQTILRGFDLAWTMKDVLTAIGFAEQDIAGASTTVLSGFAAAPTSPASLSINLAAGRIYQQAAIDNAPYVVLAADPTIVQQQGAAVAQAITFSVSDLVSGQSKWALVQAQFSQVDAVRSGDPTSGVEQYFNTNNPSQPFQGPNNSGQPGPTVRRGLVSLQVIYGTPAATGSEVPPNPTNGWVPLYLVDLTFAQTTVVANQILIAGPSVGSNVPNNYPGAPILAGLLNQHHKGTPGQAPQIDLTSEVKNKLPLANMPASNTVGGLGSLRIGSGNPNGSFAGNFNVNGALDFYWDQINLLLYVCTVTGTSTTAVWTTVAGSSTSQFAGGTATGTVNAQVVASTTPAGFARTPGQVVTFTGLNNTGSATLNVDATGAATVQKPSGGGNVNLTGGELNGFVAVIWTGTVYLLQSQILGTLATLNIGQWLKNDGAGNLTIKNGANLGDDGSGNLIVLPQFLPPVGSLLPYAGSSAPTGYLFCNGQAVSRTGATAALFAALGITFGGGDGVTTFNIPDLRGRVVAGVDGGANRLTTTTMSSQALGGIGGTETETLTLGQLPAGITSSGNNNVSVNTTAANVVTGTVIALSGNPGSFGFQALVNGSGSDGIINSQGINATAVTSTNTGGQPHPNVQPTIELNYLIKT